jgi:hypothetical protein
MKAILVVASFGILTAPAVAGNSKKTTAAPPAPAAVVAKPAVLASAEKASAPAAAAAVPASSALASALAQPAQPVADLDIPVLPADTTSALVPFPELEKGRAVAAAKPIKPGKEKPVVMKMGSDYVLGKHQAATVSGHDVEQIVPKSLSQAQIATVVQSHMADIQNCWDLLPKAQRTDACTAQLRLTISDAGQVTDIELGGDVPAGAHKCMTSAIAHWTFPVAETKSEIEYGISLRSL